MMKGFNFIICAFTILLLFGCETSTSKKGELVDYIPENPSVVFKISNFETLQKDISNNTIATRFKNTIPYKFLSEKAKLLQYLKPDGASLLSITTPTDSTEVYTFITRESASLFVADSIKNKKIETLTYQDISMQRITIDDAIAFTATKDSVFIASSSQQALQHILEGKTQEDATFKKMFALKKEADLEILIPLNNLNIADSTSVNFASWATLETAVLPDAITANGVVIAKDTMPQLMRVFEGQIAQQNELATILPTDYKAATSITYHNAEAIVNAIGAFNKQPSEKNLAIVETTNEAGSITLLNGTVFVLKSIDPSLTLASLSPSITETSSLREVPIFSLAGDTELSKLFSPLLKTTEASFLIQLGNFFVFTPTEDIANQLIIAFKNNDVLSETHYYKDSKNYISEASSMLLYYHGNKLPETIGSFFKNVSKNQIEKIAIPKYPLGLLQITHDRDFAHINIVCKEASKSKQIATNVTQEVSILLDNEILGNPQFFSNHRTNNKDIVVQDVTNTLHLYSINGKLLWSQKLDGPILGTIKEVDLLRNGKKQLAFTTASTFYILDRNGNNVGPFPIKFKDEVTQPLSVFDYDNNRKYRFVITQGNELLMYDSQAKIVKGFGFKKTNSKIVQAPKHIRIGNKDYIIVTEANGKLNILSRVGKSRVSVKKTFTFTTIPVTREGSSFVVITKDNKKATIDQKGNVSFKNLEVSSSYWFATKGAVKATLDDNLLRINGKLVELPFGIYTPPKLFAANRTTYVTVTETQENKVYVYDKTGRLLSGFPVYGGKEAIIGSVKNQTLLVTSGNAKEIIVYGF